MSARRMRTTANRDPPAMRRGRLHDWPMAWS